MRRWRESATKEMARGWSGQGRVISLGAAGAPPRVRAPLQGKSRQYLEEGKRRHVGGLLMKSCGQLSTQPVQELRC